MKSYHGFSVVCALAGLACVALVGCSHARYPAQTYPQTQIQPVIVQSVPVPVSNSGYTTTVIHEKNGTTRVVRRYANGTTSTTYYKRGAYQAGGAGTTVTRGTSGTKVTRQPVVQKIGTAYTGTIGSPTAPVARPTAPVVAPVTRPAPPPAPVARSGGSFGGGFTQHSSFGGGGSSSTRSSSSGRR